MTAATIELMVTHDERQDFSDRLNLVLDEEGYPPKGGGRQKQLAKDWGLSQKGVRKWLEGEGVPETMRLVEMAKRYRVSFEWLATGRDPATLQPCSTVVRRAPATDLQTVSYSGPAKRLLSAIEDADKNGMRPEAFNILRETLGLFGKGAFDPDEPFEIEDPGP